MKRERRSFSPVDRRSGVTQVVLQVVFNPADVMTRRTPDRPGELVSLGIILVSGQGRVDS